MPAPTATFDPVSFGDLPGWDQDDHLAAWKAFLASCGPVLKAGEAAASDAAADAGGAKKSKTAKIKTTGYRAPRVLLDACRLALVTAKSGAIDSRAAARHFFETYFRPHTVNAPEPKQLLTGYYEPLLKGSRTPDKTYRVPVYRRPSDLVNVVAESERGAKSNGFTHLRATADGNKPYLTRAAIEQGGLKGQGLELLYFKDPVDVFFMQIQGSGRVELPDGEIVRITYDGKNGYPYTSVGKLLIEEGQMTTEEMSLKSLRTWLREDAERGQKAMWKNESYVFFRELKGSEAESAMGVNCIPLQPGRSLAVDTAFHSIGTPIYVVSQELKHATKSKRFERLMIAQDVGSAIKGSERGDIYFGSGDAAGKLAGVTKHPGKFYVLLPEEKALKQTLASGAP